VAQACNFDGSIITGFSDATPSGPRAFRWTAAGGMVDIGVMPSGSVSQPYSMSGGGNTIVGSGNGVGGARAFRWTNTGGMVNLGALPTGVESGARAVSGNAKVIVGYSDTFFGLRATIWPPAAPVTSISDFLAVYGANLSNWTLLNANGVSTDGLTVVGTGTGPGGQRGWVAHLPVLPCDANCDGSTSPPLLNMSDYICFITRFAAGASSANCDASTTPPVLNIFDYICFQTKFAAGCP
jgi:probable HAF family extracellular repeat protein